MDIAGRGFGDPGEKLRRGGEEKEKKIAGGGLLGQKKPPVSRYETAGGTGKAAYGGLFPGEGDALCAAAQLSGGMGTDGRTEANSVRSGCGQGRSGLPGMGLEASAILGDVERIEEGILIAIDALERAVDRLAITRQMALDMMEE